MAVDVFPGRAANLDRLAALARSDNLGQPLLFIGPPGAGKEVTALEFARRLNCAAPDACAPAARCESCVKALSFQHPDIRWFGPAPATAGDDEVQALFAAKQADPFHRSPWAASAFVGIGDPEHPGPLTVRSLIHFARRRAFQSPWKVAVVADAQRLHAGAANALLKTLEEPAPRTVIMLLANGTAGLLPTIVSRCQEMRFSPWTPGELAPLLTERTGIPPAEAQAAARAADGDARRALELLEPVSRMLAAWALQLFDGVHAGNRAAAALAADDLHRGTVPTDVRPTDVAAKECEAKTPVARRERAIRLCEMLNMLYGEAVACRERGEAWEPRLPAAAAAVARAATGRRTLTLLEDIRRVDDARVDIDHNLNIGLVMAVLGEELIAHVERDQA